MITKLSNAPEEEQISSGSKKVTFLKIMKISLLFEFIIYDEKF